MRRAFDGRQMTAILVAGFGIVIAINLYAAVVAKRTFGGVVVENSYAASQDYNRWLAEAEKERALGWKAVPHRRADGRIALTLTGVPAGARVIGEARHPLGSQPDVVLHFGAGHISREVLPQGRWTLRIAIDANGTIFRSESEVL